jgi:hypothetical protein
MEWKVKFSRIACGFCFSTVALAASPTHPLEVLGVPLGASAETLHQLIPLIKCYGATCSFDPIDAAIAQCGPMSSNPGVLDCYAQAGSEYAFGPARGAKYTAYLKDGRVGEFRITFPIASADEVVSALREEYGAPSDDREFDAQNRLGLKFHNRAVAWRRADGEITVERRSVDVDTGLATFAATWYSRGTVDAQEIAGKSDATPQ